MARKVAVEIVGDSRKLTRAFSDASRSARRFNTDIGKVGRGSLAASGAFRGMGRSVAFASGGFLTGAGLTAGLRSSVAAASDLEEQIGKTNVVFGESSQAVIAWSESLASAFGLSQREALTLASTFGALLAPIGIVGKRSADTSEELTQLGADLASFYNTDVASALDAIRSGIVGESEPLRRYGVLLSETRVQQEALNETGKKSAKNLTDQEKVLARIALIFKDSKQAQGDFARTSKDAANQAKILNANVENLKATLGASLLPVLNRVVTALNEFAEAASGGPQEGPVTGQGVETTLVPLLAKRIAAYKKAHVSGKEILRLLRLQVGDSQKANDLIAEAFVFSRDPKLRARIEQQEKERKKLDDARGKGPRHDPTAPGEVRAREAVRQQTQDLAQLAVDRTALTKSTADDLAALQKLNALLKRRIAGGHDTLEIQREQLSVQLQINDLLAQQQAARKAAREKAAKDAQEARTARQFRLLGFGPTGEDLVPGVKVLKRQLKSVDDAISGSFLDTRKTRGLLGHIRQVLAAGTNSVSADVRSKIKSILDDLRGQLKQSSVDVTRFQKTARGQFVGAGAHPAGVGAVVVNGGIHLHGIQDVKALEDALRRRAKQRGHARGGRR